MCVCEGGGGGGAAGMKISATEAGMIIIPTRKVSCDISALIPYSGFASGN